MMKLLLTLLLASLALMGQASATKDQKIAQILDLTQRVASVDNIVAAVRAQLEQAQPRPTEKQLKKRGEALEKIEKLLRQRMEKIRPEMVRIYSAAFTDEEVDGLLQFYQSPAGKASLEKLPQVIDRVGGMIQTQIDTLTDEINKLAEETLKN